MRVGNAIGALVGATLAGACASEPAPAGRMPSPRAPPVASAASASPAQSASDPAGEATAEPALGVTDRGVFADLEQKLRLPPPSDGKALSALVDRRRALLVVYADDWPEKVYPLSGPAELVVGEHRLKLRAGDKRELAGRLTPTAVRELPSGEAAPPGDHDDDGIPDPLDLLIGAHKAALDGASYDDAYFPLKYPGGDPPRNRGACVDVIIRATRNAGVDLQRAIIEDERASGAAYGVSRPDPNIDHRRVRNAIVYFERHWQKRSRALDDASDPVRPGDVVFLDTFASRPGPDHVGIVTRDKGESGLPVVINLWTFGYKTQAMDLLGSVPVTHRFRFPSRS